MLLEWFKRNPVSKKKMLDVIEEWESIKPFETDDIESLEKAVAEHGRRYVAYQKGVSEETIKSHKWKFRRFDDDGKRRKETPIHKEAEQEPIFDIFDERSDEDNHGIGDSIFNEN